EMVGWESNVVGVLVSISLVCGCLASSLQSRSQAIRYGLLPPPSVKKPGHMLGVVLGRAPPCGLDLYGLPLERVRPPVLQKTWAYAPGWVPFVQNGGVLVRAWREVGASLTSCH